MSRHEFTGEESRRGAARRAEELRKAPRELFRERGRRGGANSGPTQIKPLLDALRGCLAAGTIGGRAREVALVLLETGSNKAAAERLGVSPSRVSQLLWAAVRRAEGKG